MTGWSVCHMLLLLTISWNNTNALTVTTNFNMDGVNGTITFTQQSPTSITMIRLSLTGLDQYPSEQFPWHVHNYPFRTRPDFCSVASVGGRFDPFMASSQPDYSAVCMNNRSLCEVGDLSGKFGRLNPDSMTSEVYEDVFLPLYGVYSIVGRSVVIHRGDGACWVCANIEYPTDVTIAYSPFRNVLAGNIYFIQPYMPVSLTTVFTRLSNISGSVNSIGHNWHVHENAIGDRGDCVEGGPHYNPRRIPVSSPTYETYCNPSNQTSCEIGDLTGKSSRLDFMNGRTTSLYTDTELPLRVNSDGYNIVGRSVVIHASNAGGPRIACANVTKYSPRMAVARFQEDGVSGQIIFHQVSPFSPTNVTVELTGLSSRASGYHLHDFPVDETVPGSEKCANSFAGGHFNPRNVIQDTSSPTTFDAYEIGDLSGKYGSLAGQDSINVIYSDPYLPLFGVDSIVGRSIVIHYPNGSRWLCANIKYDMETVSVTVDITSETLQGKLVLTQLANDPFSETMIFLDVDYTGPPISVMSSPSMTPTPTQLSTSIMLSTSMSMSTSISTTLPSSSSSMISLSSSVSTMLPTSSSSTMTSMSTSTVLPSVASTSTSTTTSVMQPSTPTMLLSSSMVSMSTSTVLSSFATSVMTSMSTTTSTIAAMSTTALLSSSSTMMASMSASSVQPQTTSMTQSVCSSTAVVSSTVIVSTTPTIEVTTSTPAVTISTTSTNDDAKTTSSEVKEETTTSVTEALTTSSTSLTVSSMMSVSFDPDPMMTMDMSSMLPSPTGGARRKRDVFKRQIQGSDGFIHLSIQTSCGAGAPAVNPYGAPLTCSPDNQLACPVGDLTGKHGVLSERSLLTDLNLPLSGPNAISGSGLAVRVGDDSMLPIVCVQLPAANVSPKVMTTTTSTVSATLPTTPTLNPPNYQPSATDKKLIIIASGTTAGVIVVAFLVLVLAISYCLWKRHKKRSQYFGGTGQSTIGYQQLSVELNKQSRFRRTKKHEDEDDEDCVEL